MEKRYITYLAFILNNIIFCGLLLFFSSYIALEFESLQSTLEKLEMIKEKAAVSFCLFIFNFIMFYKRKIAALLLNAVIYTLFIFYIISTVAKISFVLIFLAGVIVFIEIIGIKGMKDLKEDELTPSYKSDKIINFCITLDIITVLMQLIIVRAINGNRCFWSEELRNNAVILNLSSLAMAVILIISFKFREKKKLVLNLTVISFFINLGLYIWYTFFSISFSKEKFSWITLIVFILLIVTEVFFVISSKKYLRNPHEDL